MEGGDGVVAGFVEDVEGDGDAFSGWLVAFFYWSLTSVTAARAALSSTMEAPSAYGATRVCTARLLLARGRPREALWMRATTSSEKRVSDLQFEVMGDVVAGVGGGGAHVGKRVAQRHALIERGEGAETEPGSQGRLADQER